MTPLPARPARRPLRVLVVDDSATVRQVLIGILPRSEFEVTTAPDPLIALGKMKAARPDVILTDLEMPRMDGLTFLRTVMSADPIPMVVCSGLAGSGTEAALLALEEGAVSIVAKPKLGVKQFLEESAVRLGDALRAAAGARLRPRLAAPAPTRRPGDPPRERPAASTAVPPARLRLTTDTVVAVGASTGGTEALRLILEALPADAPGLVIVQHMPEGFTRAFAQRLDGQCRIEVREAADGDRVREGCALVAPGNRHLELRRSGGHYVVVVNDGPLVSRHRPSVDVLFRSVAEAAGANAVGVLLTGMGGDGARGLLDMRRAGAATLAQDEESCVVFGMPKEAIALGAVDEVVSLAQIPARLLRRADGGRAPVR